MQKYTGKLAIHEPTNSIVIIVDDQTGYDDMDSWTIRVLVNNKLTWHYMSNFILL